MSIYYISMSVNIVYVEKVDTEDHRTPEKDPEPYGECTLVSRFSE